MRQLCQLCGAKLYPEDETCRQCGTALGADGPDDPPASEDQTAAPADEDSAASPPDADAPLPGAPPVKEDSWPLDIPLPPRVEEPSESVAAEAEPTSESEPEQVPTLPGDFDQALPDTNGITPPSMQAPVAVDLDDLDDRPSGGRTGLVVGVVAVVLVAGGLAVYALRGAGEEPAPTQAADPEPPPEASVEPEPPAPQPAPVEPRDGCEQLEPLAGKWEFTSEVVTSTNPAQLGMRGFYRLEVEVDGCEATAEVTKIGYTGRWYKDKQVQRGTSALKPAPHFGFSGTFDLRSESGRGGSQELVFSVVDNHLIGMYIAGPRTGFLEGARDPGRRLLPALRKQPCLTRCAMACDLAHRDADAAAREALQRCETTCAASDAPVCGDAQPLPSSFLARIGGPEVSLSAACQAVGAEGGCRMNVRAGDRPANALRKLEEEWRGAQLGAAKGSLYLGLRTAAGWFAAGPLLSSEDLTSAQLLVRDLSSPQKYILASVSGASGDATAVCRLEDDKPACAVVPAGSGAVHPLAHDGIALSQTVGELAPGIYTW